MPTRARLVTRLTPAEAESFAMIARLHGRSVSAELAQAARAHIAATADVLNNEAPEGDGPERSRRPWETATLAPER